MKRIFRYFWSKQKKLMLTPRDTKKLEKKELAADILILISLPILMLFHNRNEPVVLSIILLTGVSISVSYFWVHTVLFEMCTSASKFFRVSFSLLVYFTLCFMMVFLKVSHAFSSPTSLYAILTVYVVFCVAIMLLWCWFSFLANADVASLANTVLTTLFTVAVLIVNFATDIINAALHYADASNIGVEMRLLTFNMLLLPLLLMTAVLAAMCQFKKYWVEKYNGSKDINAECIINDPALTGFTKAKAPIRHRANKKATPK